MLIWRLGGTGEGGYLKTIAKHKERKHESSRDQPSREANGTKESTEILQALRKTKGSLPATTRTNRVTMEAPSLRRRTFESILQNTCRREPRGTRFASVGGRASVLFEALKFASGRKREVGRRNVFCHFGRPFGPGSSIRSRKEPFCLLAQSS